MKKFTVLIALVLLLSLTACRATQVDPSEGPLATGPSAEPTTEPTAAPTEEPTDPVNRVQAELAQFTELFGDTDSWYNKALNQLYYSPQELVLYNFFAGGFAEESQEYTEQELQELPKLDFSVELDPSRLPTDRVNAVLQQYFGITLADLEEKNLYRLTYLESTDCYYCYTTQTYVMGFQATEVEHKDDGTVAVRYMRTGTSGEDTLYEVGLKPNGEGYQILYNCVAGYDPSQSEQEELAKFTALFGDVKSWYNKAVAHRYNTPQELDLYAFFNGGFDDDTGEYTDSEMAGLLALGFNENLDFFRLPPDKMEQVLQQYYGITLEDLSDGSFAKLTYLESTGNYYYNGGGAYVVINFKAIDMETKDDGTIALFYTGESIYPSDVVYEVGLKPNGDGYQILYNRIADK